MSSSTAAALLTWLLLHAWACGAETLTHGRFQDMEIYRPSGDVQRLVLFLSGSGGWDARLAGLGHALARDGALVAGIDLPRLLAALEQDGGRCVVADGDLENLSHFLQAYYRLPDYTPPLLAGYAAGATFVYAMLAQAPAGTFGGGVSLAFCPTLPLRKPLCPGTGLQVIAGARAGPDVLAPAQPLAAPWRVVQGALDRRCGVPAAQRFLQTANDGGLTLVPGAARDLAQARGWAPALRAAVQALSERERRPAPAAPAVVTQLRDLPIIEAPAAGAGELLALIMSGDGGWAGLDKALAAALTARGIPVVGFDSLRYFWSARTPRGTATDVERVLSHYLDVWHKRQALLIGYSQGADVLPFVVNRLSPSLRARVRLAALLGPGRRAVFEFHLSDWLPGGDDDERGLPIQPEVERISAVHVLCVHGADEDPGESLCSDLALGNVQVLELPGGHHFDGDYPRLAASILQAASASRPDAAPGARSSSRPR